MNIFENLSDVETPMLEFAPLTKVLVCPAKMFMLKELNKKGRIEIMELSNSPHILQPSIKRHIHELIEDKLAYSLNEFLIITENGAKIARDIDMGTKLSKIF